MIGRSQLAERRSEHTARKREIWVKTMYNDDYDDYDDKQLRFVLRRQKPRTVFRLKWRHWRHCRHLSIHLKLTFFTVMSRHVILPVYPIGLLLYSDCNAVVFVHLNFWWWWWWWCLLLTIHTVLNNKIEWKMPTIYTGWLYWTGIFPFFSHPVWYRTAMLYLMFHYCTGVVSNITSSLHCYMQGKKQRHIALAQCHKPHTAAATALFMSQKELAYSL